MLIDQIVSAARAAARVSMPAELTAGAAPLVDQTVEPLFNKITSLMNSLTLENCGYELPSPIDLLPGSQVGHVQEKFTYGLSRSMSPSRVRRYSASVVTFSQQPSVTVLAFCLNPDKQIPLHDHPRMHGWLKVVRGSVRVTSYSLLEGAALQDCLDAADAAAASSYVPAVLAAESTLQASSGCARLQPQSGNVHRVQAVGGVPAAFVDVLMPSYSDAHGRPCHYFTEVNEQLLQSARLPGTVAGQQIAWLRRVAPPTDYSTIDYPASPLRGAD